MDDCGFEPSRDSSEGARAVESKRASKRELNMDIRIEDDVLSTFVLLHERGKMGWSGW